MRTAVSTGVESSTTQIKQINPKAYLLWVRVPCRPIQPRRHAVLAPEHQAAALLLYWMRVRVAPSDSDAVR